MNVLRRRRPPLMLLDDALEAFGDDGIMGSYDDEVSLDAVVGSVARVDDFDEDFRLVNPALKPRWKEVARAFSDGAHPAPIDVVRLGELFFVRDGHHRVSVARSLGWRTLPARVHRICTVAYAMCCLRVAHLDSKAAERRFLERVPLPFDVREDLWLDRPADWARLADSAEAWAYRLRGPEAGGANAHEFATAWWEREVTPVLDQLRKDDSWADLRDIQLYVTALAVRDEVGALDWPDDLARRLREGQTCCHRPLRG